MKFGAVIIENRNIDVAGVIARHKKFLPECEIIHINNPSVVDAYTYNNVITDGAFWDKLPFDKVLVFQADSWLVRHGVEEFFEYDYVGAPWQWQHEGGNGGLSLRTKSVMLDIIKKFPYSSLLGNEDVYFSNHIGYVGGKLAPREVCSKFSMEATYYPNTLGVHSARGKEVYDKFYNKLVALHNAHKGQEIYIIGKGVSLQHLRKEHIGEGVVMAMNQSIIPVEQLGVNNIVYSMQKDGCGSMAPHRCEDRKPNDMVRPLKSILLVHELESNYCLADYSPRYIFNNTEIGLLWQDPSIFSAIKIAKYMGCSKINIVSCDSLVNDSNDYYSPGIGTFSHSYLVHKERTLNELQSIPHSFITPEPL
jgi:hypothetical protein